MSSPPHPVMHLGMTGWVELRHLETAYYRRRSPKVYPLTEWPPKAWRFALTTDGPDPFEAAFVDQRRFARVRLVDCPGADIRAVAPLSANGPDPVIDADVVTEAWLREGMKNRRVPVKALLLDQAFLSGVGNWVGDEVLYHAGIHPEQVAATFTKAQTKRLHEALMYVTELAVRVVANGDRVADEGPFPEHWLFKHRWGKGSKDSPNQMPDGRRITFVTVGGRTSAVVEGAQKLVKRMPKDEEDEDGEQGGDEEVDATELNGTNGVEGEGKGRKANGVKRKAPPSAIESSKKRTAANALDNVEESATGKRKRASPKSDSKSEGDSLKVSTAVKENEPKSGSASKAKNGASKSKGGSKPATAKRGQAKVKNESEGQGRRRSTRLSGGGDV